MIRCSWFGAADLHWRYYIIIMICMSCILYSYEAFFLGVLKILRCLLCINGPMLCQFLPLVSDMESNINILKGIIKTLAETEILQQRPDGFSLNLIRSSPEEES